MKNDKDLRLDELQKFITETEILFASRHKNGNSKELKCDLFGGSGYKVYHNGKLVKKCSQPYPAIDMFNEIIL